MSEGFVADLSAETGDKDRWQRINRDRREGIMRQKKQDCFCQDTKVSQRDETCKAIHRRKLTLVRDS